MAATLQLPPGGFDKERLWESGDGRRVVPIALRVGEAEQTLHELAE